MDNNLGFLAAAYSIVWIFIAGYIFTIAQRQKGIENDLADLKNEMKKK